MTDDDELEPMSEVEHHLWAMWADMAVRDRARFEEHCRLLHLTTEELEAGIERWKAERS